MTLREFKVGSLGIGFYRDQIFQGPLLTGNRFPMLFEAFQKELDRFLSVGDRFVYRFTVRDASLQRRNGHRITTLWFLSQKDSIVQKYHIHRSYYLPLCSFLCLPRLSVARIRFSHQ